MATSGIPAVIDALFTAATAALPDVQVLDGYGVADTQRDFLMIGVDDPDSEFAARSVPAEQQVATMSPLRQRDERGEIFCVAVAWKGANNQKATRDRAFEIVAAVEDLVRDVGGPGNLGVPGVRMPQIGSINLSQDQSEAGSFAMVVFSVRYLARI
jgi:hypothetical protein